VVPASLSEDAVERHFRSMLRDTRVLSLEDLTGHHAVGCMDGRRAQCVAGVPGASAGLLILLLASLEARSGRPLPTRAVHQIFRRYLDHFGSFQIHTDRAAQRRLARALGHEPDQMIRNPPDHLRASVLEAILDPDHVGCGHLRLLLEEPDAYGVRRELVEAVLTGFFLRLWDGDPRLVLGILDGDHHEGGVVRIRAEPPRESGPWHDRDCTPAAPALVTACPRHRGLDLFVYHPDAVAWLHAMHAVFLATRGLIAPDQIPACAAAQQRLGEQHLEATLLRLAPELPVFDVWIGPGKATGPRDVTVQFQGRVGEPSPLANSRT
jgi:hypothetical protein